MATNPVIWFEIYVQDMERAKKFYEAVLQTKLEKLNNPELEMWAFPWLKTASEPLVLWSKCRVFLPAETALWFISAASIAPSRPLAS
jgi:catechol 2,3-dioxygenase-like lactoylglutathione lyase family enzyme